MIRSARRRAAFGAMAAVALLAAVLALLPLARQGAAAQGLRHVGPGGVCGGESPCHASIQEAADAAQDGDTIRVGPGRYTETVTLSGRDLRIEGAEPSPGEGDVTPLVRWTAAEASGIALRATADGAPAASLRLARLRFDGAGLVLDGLAAEIEALRFEAPPVPALDIRVAAGELSAENITVRGALSDAIRLRPADGPPVVHGAVRLEALEVDGAAGSGVAADGLVGGLRLVGLDVGGVAGSAVAFRDVLSASLRTSRLAAAEDGEAALRIAASAAAPEGARIAVGGNAEGSVDLSGGPRALLLVGPDAGPWPGPAIEARYVDWGAAWEDEIRARMERRPADLAGVTLDWRPALGAVDALDLEPEPSEVVADGVATATLRLTLRDGADRLARDGALVRLEATGAELDGAGATVDAADPALERTGEWGRFDTPRFGDFEGDGWILASEADASLRFTFDAPAAALRLGHQDLGGVAEVRVVGRPALRIATAGEEARWVDHLVAEDLGPGPHELLLRVLDGPVAVDLAAFGRTARGGELRAVLRAPAQVGRAELRATALGANGEREARASVDFVPGPAVTGSLSLSSPSMMVGARVYTVTAELRDAAGRPVRDGTPVRFQASTAQIDPGPVATRGGRASTAVTSPLGLGATWILATAGAPPQELTVSRLFLIVPGPPAQLRIRAERSAMAANSHDRSALLVEVRDERGYPVADGVTVTLRSSEGTVALVDELAPGQALTREGVVRGELRAGATAGEALLRAEAGDAVQEARVELLPTDVRVAKFVEPESVVVPGEWVTYTVRYENVGEGSVYGLRIEDRLPAGLISPSLTTSGPALARLGGAPYTFAVDRIAPGQVGTIRVRARIDTSLRWGRQDLVTNTVSAFSPEAAERSPQDNRDSATVVVVPSAVFTVTLETPASLPVGGATAEIRVRVQDRFGRPASDGTPVSLSADIGRIEPALVTTSGGRALATYSTDRQAGVATIRALSLENRGRLAKIRITPGPASRLALTAGSSAIPVGGGRAVLTATLSDLYGNAVPDAVVAFQTDRGVLSREAVRTDEEGRATATLRSGVRAGPVHVQARHDTIAEGIDLRFDAGPAATISIEAPRYALPGGSTRLRARLRDEYDNPVARGRVVFETTIGSLREVVRRTDESGLAETILDTPGGGFGYVSAHHEGLVATAPLLVERPRVHLPIGLR